MSGASECWGLAVKTSRRNSAHSSRRSGPRKGSKHMDNTQARQLQQDIMAAAERLHIDALSEELAVLQQESQAPDFWQDNLHAQDVMKQISKLEARVRPWQGLLASINDDIELLEGADTSMEIELLEQINDVAAAFDGLKEQL